MKTLIKKSTGEYLHYTEGEFYTGKNPDILSDTASEALIQAYHIRTYDLPPIDFSDVKLVNIKITIEEDGA